MKKSRHTAILDVIQQFDIETQEELVDKLKSQGYEVTQATVSRDIRELKLTKMAGKNGRQRYVAMAGTSEELGDRYTRVLKEGLTSMDTAQTIVVVKTVSGMAMAVAAALDAMQIQEIVGTIAGDDTIMLAVRSPEDGAKIMDIIEKRVHI